MVRMEGNICTYRYGEILHTSAALVHLGTLGSDPIKLCGYEGKKTSVKMEMTVVYWEQELPMLL